MVRLSSFLLPNYTVPATVSPVGILSQRFEARYGDCKKKLLPLFEGVRAHGRSVTPMMIAALDQTLMSVYGLTGVNARRLARFALALLPLMVLLVGSCKTPEIQSRIVESTRSEQLRNALFPDRASHLTDARYTPAAGYISQARTFIADQPQSLMMLTQQEIRYLFGKPTLHRQDADAEVWQYKANGCVVDFYFYDDQNRTGQSQTSYVDFRMQDELVPGSAARAQPISTGEKSDCLHSVLSRGAFSVPT